MAESSLYSLLRKGLVAVFPYEGKIEGFYTVKYMMEGSSRIFQRTSGVFTDKSAAMNEVRWAREKNPHLTLVEYEEMLAEQEARMRMLPGNPDHLQETYLSTDGVVYHVFVPQDDGLCSVIRVKRSYLPICWQLHNATEAHRLARMLSSSEFIQRKMPRTRSWTRKKKGDD